MFTSLIVQIRRVLALKWTGKITEVYIPHSSDKTNEEKIEISFLREFTSLIVQIRPQHRAAQKAKMWGVYIPHSSDKTHCTVYLGIEQFKCLHPS